MARHKARWGKPFGRTNPGIANPTFIQTIIAIEGEIQDEETYTWGPQRVYVVRAGDSLKIGVTQNIKQRIRLRLPLDHLRSVLPHPFDATVTPRDPFVCRRPLPDRAAR